MSKYNSIQSHAKAEILSGFVGSSYGCIDHRFTLVRRHSNYQFKVPIRQVRNHIFRVENEVPGNNFLEN